MNVRASALEANHRDSALRPSLSIPTLPENVRQAPVGCDDQKSGAWLTFGPQTARQNPTQFTFRVSRSQSTNRPLVPVGTPITERKALLSRVGDAQEVADAVLRILETPAVEKQLRYRISAASFGGEEINALSR